MIVAISIIYMVLVAMFSCVIIISAHKERDEKAREITERSDINMVGKVLEDNGKTYTVTKVERISSSGWSNLTIYVEECKEKEE